MKAQETLSYLRVGCIQQGKVIKIFRKGVIEKLPITSAGAQKPSLLLFHCNIYMPKEMVTIWGYIEKLQYFNKQDFDIFGLCCRYGSKCMKPSCSGSVRSIPLYSVPLSPHSDSLSGRTMLGFTATFFCYRKSIIICAHKSSPMKSTLNANIM